MLIRPKSQMKRYRPLIMHGKKENKISCPSGTEIRALRALMMIPTSRELLCLQFLKKLCDGRVCVEHRHTQPHAATVWRNINWTYANVSQTEYSTSVGAIVFLFVLARTREIFLHERYTITMKSTARRMKREVIR